jgi:taurine dioxygenase
VPALLTPRQLSAAPLTPAIGSVVADLDLRDLAGETAAELVALVRRRGMVVVPGQHLDEAEHLALARHFGRPAVTPLRRLLGMDRPCALIADDAEHPPAGFAWHTDESWTETPPAFGILCALTIPASGGDTIWASTAAAYERLAPALRDLADSLSVEHHMGADYLATVARHHGDRIAGELVAAHPPVEQPLVREAGDRRALYLSPLYATSIDGLDAATGTALLDVFHRTLEDPEVQVRWRWSEGDVVIWDEATTCHRALTDHFPATRRMRRCTTAGSRPVRAR